MTVTAGRARTAAFLVVAGAWFAMMAGSNVATPLYATYEREFGFSSAVLTLVFATYALFLAPSLLLFGQLSDRLGRRRVMAAGFATATRRPGAVRARRQPAVAVRGARRAGPGGGDDQRRGGRGAGGARPGAAGGPRRAVRGARAGRRQRLGADHRGDAGRVGAGAARAARSSLFAVARRGGDGRGAGDPGAGPRGPGTAAGRAPERPARDPRPVRARERHRSGGLGRRRALPLRRALLRRRPAGHVEPGAARARSAR